MTKITLALISLFVGLAGASYAHAGAGNVLLGQSSFEDRCYTIGGTLDAAGKAIACDLGKLTVSCDFAAAYASCEWNGAQGHRTVTRLIGAITPESIVDGVEGGSGPSGGKGKGKGGGFQDLPKKGF